MAYILLIAVIIWDIYWKYIALLHCAKVGNKKWFIAILAIGSAGVLPIYYLYKNNYFKE